MSGDEFLTISEPGYAQTRVLGSRFIGSALHTKDMEAIESYLVAERKHYHDATHWCFAFRIGLGSLENERASDAGEPKGTAGVPILREIQERDLANCLVIVTRYFGGTKLGTGNLARAYADCAAQALAAATITRRRILESWVVTCPFDLVSVVYHHAQKLNAEVEPLESFAQATFRIRVSPSESALLAATLREESRGRVEIRPE